MASDSAGTKPLDLQAGHQRRGQHDHRGVDDEREEAERGHRQRQREDHDDGPHEGVQAGDDGRREEGGEEVLHQHAGQQVAKDEQDKGLQEPGEEDAPRGLLDALASQREAGRQAAADGPSEAHDRKRSGCPSGWDRRPAGRR